MQETYSLAPLVIAKILPTERDKSSKPRQLQQTFITHLLYIVLPTNEANQCIYAAVLNPTLGNHYVIPCLL